MTAPPTARELVLRDAAWIAATSSLAERALVERDSHRTYEQLRLWGGRDLVVNPDVPCFYQTISAALVHARDGDHVRVTPGEYSESLTITKDVTLEGTSMVESPTVWTVLNGEPPLAVIIGRGAPAVTIAGTGAALNSLVLAGGGPVPTPSGERGIRRSAALALINSTSQVERVRVGDQYYAAHGVVIQGGEPTLRRCKITHLKDDFDALVIEHGSRAHVEDSEVCQSDRDGVWIGDEKTAPTVTRSHISSNGRFGICIANGATAVVLDSTILSNREAGVSLDRGGGYLKGNLITSNGAGIRVVEGDPRLEDNEIVDNRYDPDRLHRDALELGQVIAGTQDVYGAIVGWLYGHRP